MAHFFGNDTAKGLAVVFAGRSFKKSALLLNGGEFGIALVDDEVQKSVAHTLVGDLHDAFPLGAAAVGAEFDFVGTSGAEFGFKLIVGDFRVGDPNVFLPNAKEIDPIIEGGKTCCRHERLPPNNYY